MIDVKRNCSTFIVVRRTCEKTDGAEDWAQKKAKARETRDRQEHPASFHHDDKVINRINRSNEKPSRGSQAHGGVPSLVCTPPGHQLTA